MSSSIDYGLIEFDLKVRTWASSSTEGITILWSLDSEKSNIFVKNLFNLLEHRKQLANKYLDLKGHIDNESSQHILDLIHLVNNDIKKVMGL